MNTEEGLFSSITQQLAWVSVHFLCPIRSPGPEALHNRQSLKSDTVLLWEFIQIQTVLEPDMSNPRRRPKFDRFLRSVDRLWLRSRTPSPVPPPNAAGSGLPDRSTGGVQVKANAVPSQPPSRLISLDDVLAELEPARQDVIREHCKQGSSEVSSSIQKAAKFAEGKRQLCVDRRWKVALGGKTIVLREKADAVVTLIGKFKDIGSIAVDADPVHAGLPWAGICMLLQIAIAEKEQMDALLSGLLVALSIQQTADIYLAFLKE